jgi:hypothetical protein
MSSIVSTDIPFLVLLPSPPAKKASARPRPGRNKKARRSGARTMLLPLEDELPNEFDRFIAFRGNRFAAR